MLRRLGIRKITLQNGRCIGKAEVGKETREDSRAKVEDSEGLGQGRGSVSMESRTGRIHRTSWP